MTSGDFIIHSPIGILGITLADDCITKIELFAKRKNSPLPKLQELEIKTQLKAYFLGQKKQFSLPLKYLGTPFQKCVWQALLDIPYGQTKTYGQIAKQLKSSAQAIGNACRANPIPLIIPCHRVVSAVGIGGFAGKTTGKRINVKQYLLQLEGQAK